MANLEQVRILKKGAEVWNKWRKKNPKVKIKLRKVNLSGANLKEVNFFEADLSEANLRGANLIGADLRANLSKADLRKANLYSADLDFAILTEADLSDTNLVEAILVGANLNRSNLIRADLSEAYLVGADFSGADLSEAIFYRTNLGQANLTGANLSRTNLQGASLIGTNIDKAKISGSSVYGISVWDLKGKFEDQKDLIITREGETVITADNIKVAQFLYLILNNEEIRDVINLLTSRTVLILGRFVLPERKEILEALRITLRKYNLLPIVFDFERPTDKDFTETIKTLAGLSYFVIADVTNPKSSPLELQATVPDYQIPFVPIIQEGEQPFSMMVDLQKKYDWVLNTITYDSAITLMRVLKPLIIDPAMKKHNELRLIKAQELDVISGRDYLVKGEE